MEGLENTSWMKSDPICHENEEEAFKDHCDVMCKLAVLRHESNKKMGSGVQWYGGKTWLTEWVDKAQITGALVTKFSHQFLS